VIPLFNSWLIRASCWVQVLKRRKLKRRNASCWDHILKSRSHKDTKTAAAQSTHFER
jgi:hypothetical protein